MEKNLIRPSLMWPVRQSARVGEGRQRRPENSVITVTRSIVRHGGTKRDPLRLRRKAEYSRRDG
jgi:hypothetical protein